MVVKWFPGQGGLPSRQRSTVKDSGILDISRGGWGSIVEIKLVCRPR